MGVYYNPDVATSRKFGSFLHLLLRWTASLYKLVWLDLLIFLVLYYMLSFWYRYGMNDGGKHVFENIVLYCQANSNLIPLSFVLGFFVSIVMTRWWDQYMNMAWPDPLAVYVSSLIKGQDDYGRLLRRTIMRYTMLQFTMAMMLICPGVKKRFRTYDQLIDVGLLTEKERDIFLSLDAQFPKYSKYFLPAVWAASITARARREGRIRDDFATQTIISELNKQRNMCHVLVQYDMISVPLVYTQVVTLAVYTYFLGALMGRQWIEDSKTNKFTLDYYFPLFPTLEFLFYMGWLKVAESSICPWGEDEDDFDVNWVIDRNLSVVYLIVDEMHNQHPELVRDQYWDDVFPTELPYNNDNLRDEPPEPSTNIYNTEEKDKYQNDRRRSTHASIQSELSMYNQRRHSLMVHFDEEAHTEQGEEKKSAQSQDNDLPKDDFFDLLAQKRKDEKARKYRKQIMTRIKDTPGNKDAYNELLKDSKSSVNLLDSDEEEHFNEEDYEEEFE